MFFDFKNLIQKYNMKISGVIHIGAHYGQEISEYISLGIENMVLFEPIPENYEIMKENALKFNANIDGHRVALGNENKQVVMNISNNEGQSSSVLNPKIHLDLHPDVVFFRTEEVEMKKLDDYAYTDYNMMNIDVQGYELEVFKGASNTLNNIDYICCEVNRDQVYEGNALIEEIDQFLSSYKLKRVETFWYADQAWGEAFYIKEK